MAMPDPLTDQTASPAAIRDLLNDARSRLRPHVQGLDDTITLLFVALASRGHLLLEGLPGVGKTTLAKTFAQITGLQFGRVQLTPDLMPTDITGHSFFDQTLGEFKIRKGPVFTNILLADELNRTPPRTQAALLEVMQEQQVTIEGQTLPVPTPFLVIATKNPIEVEGVYPLPEAELDRFMVHARVQYPSRAVEAAMVEAKLRANGTQPQPVPGLVEALQRATAQTKVHPDLQGYIIDVVRATRDHEAVEHGGSPRAIEHLLAASRAHAVLEGRTYVVPDDVKALAVPVLRHRIILNADAELQEIDPDEVLREVLDRVRVPVAPKRG